MVSGFLCLWLQWEEVSWCPCWSLVHSIRYQYPFMFHIVISLAEKLLSFPIISLMSLMEYISHQIIMSTVMPRHSFLHLKCTCFLVHSILNAKAYCSKFFRWKWTSTCGCCNLTTEYLAILPLLLESYYKTFSGIHTFSLLPFIINKF